MRKTLSLWIGLMIMGAWGCLAQAQEQAFVPAVSMSRTPDGQVSLALSFQVKPGTYLYEAAVTVAVKDAQATLVGGDQAVEYHGDKVFKKNFTRNYRITGGKGETYSVTVGFQGCLESGVCLMPEEKTFQVTPGTAGKVDASVTAKEPLPTLPPRELGFQTLADQFEVIGSSSGYMPKKRFLGWLRQTGRDGGQVVDERDNLLFRTFSDYGLWLAMLLLLPLGLMLNLTPCVLPMIPVNLAVIGAGAKDGKRGRGFALGLAYGIGMALAYGLLGVVVVLTGSQFGALNSSPWFNGAVAVIFILLGLAMFDVFSIDLSRFRSGGMGGGMARGKLAGAFLLGALSAILAGACVAPVLIWVLVLAADLYSSGNVAGLVLPFMLGIGMALPWPVLGAGLSKMPKPGMWMVRVRQLFGVLILGLALYYGYLSYQQFRGPAPATLAAGWTDDLKAAMAKSLDSGKPVFIDFWGVSCKNCVMMDKEVFPEPEVKKALEDYVPVKFLADDLKDPLVAAAVHRYGVKGFPTYIVLRPKAKQ